MSHQDRIIDPADGPYRLPLKTLADATGLREFELIAYPNYDTARADWMELNQIYKGEELCLDWISHSLIWDHFYARRTGRQWILSVRRHGRPCAIFPMVKEDEAAPWSLCDEFIIGREYFCPPGLIHRFADLLAPIQQEDMNSFYNPICTDPFLTAPSCVIDLKSSREEWLHGYNTAQRKEFRRLSRLNQDLRMVPDTQVRADELDGILRSQLDYWLVKKGAKNEDEYSYSRDKIRTDLKLMERAQAMGKLIALYFYQEDSLLAANFSVRHGEAGVDDYLCLRDCSDQQKRRSLGIHAILGNIEHCRSLGIRHYDLSACTAPYKNNLVNTQRTHYHLYRPHSAVLTEMHTCRR